MPFHKNFWPVWEVIRDACKSVSIEPYRVDQVPQIDNIAATIFKEIENSDIILVDFSGDKDREIPNPNVVTEATHARNQKKPTMILTQNTGSLPFDWRTHRAIVYENTPECLEHLKRELIENLQGLKNRLQPQKGLDVPRKKANLVVTDLIPEKALIPEEDLIPEPPLGSPKCQKIKIKNAEIRKKNEYIRKQNEPIKKQNEQIRVQNEQIYKQNELIRKAISEIVTSSNNQIYGYKILRQVDLVAHSGDLDDNDAKIAIKEKAFQLGANGIINLRITRSRDGYVNIQGDAVEIEEA